MIAPHKPRIVILGTPVAPGNRGVMALAASLVDILANQFPNASFTFQLLHRSWPAVTVQTRNGPITVEVTTCRLSPKKAANEHFAIVLILSVLYRLLPFCRSWIRKKSRWIDSIASAMIVGDIRGGDSFSDIYGAQRFLTASLEVLTVLLIRGRIVHFPQTYGPFTGTISRLVAQATLRRSEVIIARDTFSQQYAQSLIGSKLKVHLSPDVAFRLQPIKPKDLIIVPPLPQSSVTLIGLNINGLVFNGGYTRKDDFGLSFDYKLFLHSITTKLLEDKTVHVLLVPHTYAKIGNIESDNDAATQFRASLPPELQSRVHEVTSEHDQHEIKGVIGMTEFFIGSRMHACIAALSQTIPTVGVAYSRKFAGVFESVGAKDSVVEATSTSLENSVELVVRSFQDRKKLKETLIREVSKAQNRLDQVFGETMQRLAKTR